MNNEVTVFWASPFGINLSNFYGVDPWSTEGVHLVYAWYAETPLLRLIYLEKQGLL